MRWAFSPWAVAAAVMLILSATSLLIVQSESFHSRLPAFHQFFTRENVVWLVLVMVVTKIFHELGHALACKHFGGECHEIGVLLLVFSPCLYCDVSDSWMLPNKWRRMAIAAAGMFVELVLAALATFGWWFSQPGLTHDLCLATMFVCSVSTVLFNANPLLRYDGYYMLADYLEIPNLRQKSSDILHRGMGAWFLGMKPPHDPFLPRARLWAFGAYTVAAEIYRWLVTFSILWFFCRCLAPYRLQVLGQAAACAAGASLLLQPGWKLAKFLRTPRGDEKVNAWRLAKRSSCVVAAAAALLFVPLPHRVGCSLELQPRGATAVYVEAEGTLESLHVRAGDTVEAGQSLAQLKNIDLELAAAEVSRHRRRQQAKMSNANLLRHLDENLSGQLGGFAKSIASLDRQLGRKQQELQMLHLLAPRSGMVIPPPAIRPESPQAKVDYRQGTPLDSRNLGGFLSEGALLCHIGEPGQWWADLVVDQGDVEFVHVGQTVRIKLDGFPHETLFGVISEISRRDRQAVNPQSFQNAGEKNIGIFSSAAENKSQGVAYLARVALDDPSGRFGAGYRGQARVRTAAISWGQRGMRWLQKTFHFKL